MSTAASCLRIRQSGLTLVELMIAMTLGLVLLLGVVNVFLAQRQGYRINEDLAQLQASGRVAFELMAREILKWTPSPGQFAREFKLVRPRQLQRVGAAPGCGPLLP